MSDHTKMGSTAKLWYDLPHVRDVEHFAWIKRCFNAMHVCESWEAV